MSGNNIKDQIASALTSFAQRPLPDAASELFDALGYQTKRRLKFPSLAACLAEFDRDGRAAKYLPHAASTKPADAMLVQQLTSEEISSNSAGQLVLGKSGESDTRESIRRDFDSYLFVAVPHAARTYTRTELADAARALNALFPQPVLVLFRHVGAISLAITYRRTSKREQSRDVIERKVTFIKDIACAQPHPGHLSILEDFSLAALSKARKREITSFRDLDDAWRESLSSQLLNRKFYDEIANWYFWTRDEWRGGKVKLPADVKTEADASLFLIRLLTRLIFCWFLREKTNPETGHGLIPNELFDLRRIPELIRDPSPEACTYYTAILQNLFFATLNTEMDADDQKPNRRFINEGEEDPHDEHFNTTIWRNRELLRDRPAFEMMFRQIPFLNGGLFECLDEPIFDEKGKKVGERREDGFSTKAFKQPKLPNRLFFGRSFDETYPVDLSKAYDDLARSKVNVRPLLEIFRRFKFTLTENTPIEEEVALDPELLGHVFENLLGAYNPETETIARNTTGSFYTPRVVVDWMVDEALLVQLESVLKTAIRNPKSEFEPRLRRLLSWDGLEHDFTERELEILIDAIHSLKALDPACGSGAFPMGLLQKLVLILRKLDPGNQRWKARQIAAAEAIESAPARREAMKAIERAFARDNDDYGRKLYLIENCLYGVDIQPVAVQIAKLRFFIALVVDQKITPGGENYGILALPNLETKIVAANTLMGLKRGQLLLGSNRVRELEKQLQQVRHDYFTARRYQDKKALRAKDRELCRELADALAESGECTAYDAKRLAGWNPYDTNTPAQFFDPGWMFGLAAGRRRDAASSRTTLRGNLGIINQVAGQMEIGAPENDGANAGFDLLIGNPPYVRQEELKNVIVQDSTGEDRPLKDVLKGQYECFTGTADLYVYFVERSFQLLRVGGVLSFITSNKYFRAAYGERLRTYLLYATHPRVVLDFGDTPGLFTAVAYPCIIVSQKVRHMNKGDLPNPEEFKLTDRLKQLLDSPDRTFRVMTWTPGPPVRDFPVIFDEESFPLAQRELKPSAWQLESPTGLRLLERIRAAGTPVRVHLGERVYRGLTTGFNEAFVVNRATRDRLIAEHKSSAELLKPYLRGKDVKRWIAQQNDQFLIKIPSSENHKHPWSGKSKTEAERIYAKSYPAIHSFHEQFRKALIDRYDQGHYFWELRACAYWQNFEKPKIVSTKVSIRPTFALDMAGCYLGNTAYFLPAESGAPYLLGLLNSSLFLGYAKRVFVEKQGGWYEVQPDGLESFPVPAASANQQSCCANLAQALIWLHSPGIAKKSAGAPLSLMTAYFEQWLNGLVYELFFEGELHSRSLRLFDETAKLALPALDNLSDAQKLSRLKELFEQAYDTNSSIRSMLFSLRSLEVVRIVEEKSGEPTATAAEEK